MTKCNVDIFYFYFFSIQPFFLITFFCNLLLIGHYSYLTSNPIKSTNVIMSQRPLCVLFPRRPGCGHTGGCWGPPGIRLVTVHEWWETTTVELLSRKQRTGRHKTTRAGRRRQSAFRHCSSSNCFSLLVNSAEVSYWLKWSERLSNVVSRCGVSAGTLCDAASDFGAFRQSELTVMHHTSHFFSKGNFWTKCCLYIKPACFPTAGTNAS